MIGGMRVDPQRDYSSFSMRKTRHVAKFLAPNFSRLNVPLRHIRA